MIDFKEMEYDEEETYDDYETMYANAPDTTVMIYDQRAVTALPDLLKNPEHTMPCGSLTLKQYQRGGETVTVAFEEEGKQANVTGYTVLKKDLHLLDTLYPEPRFTRVDADYQINGLWAKGCIYLGNKAYWEQ